nr:GNAT family N-acetyltransferase [Nakamurella flavida]
MDLPTAQELWRTALDGGGVLVAVAPDPPAGGAADEVIGVTRWSLADDADGVGLIGSLYVDPGHQGGGCGARLLAAATDRLRERGSRTAILWVFADNAPARGFYSRQGWRPDGTERVDARFGARELRLTLDLGPAAGPDRHEGAG